jgi:hypothetical protein
MQVAGRSTSLASRPPARREGGFIAMLMLLVLVMGSLYLIVSGLNAAATGATLHREDVTALALQQAKEALIARAAFDANRPGSLPCPDRDNDGVADLLAGNNCPSYVGRLPWKTLGLPDLRDATGSRLWYALSQPFTDSNAYPINSDTQGTLTVPGMVPSGGIVAIVFAPGTVVGAQRRDGPVGGTTDSPCTWGIDENCKIANYLEGQNASIDTAYEQSPRCERTDCPGGVPFNDQLMIITHADLFAIVEPVVAKRIEKEIVPILSNDPAANGYFERWGTALYGDKRRGFFPFAAPYDNPGRPTDDYLGVYAQTNGLLPVTGDSDGSRVRWNAPPAVGDPDPPTLSVVSGAGTVTFNPATGCYISGVSGFAECMFDYSCMSPTCTSLQVQFQARLTNVAGSLLMNPDQFVNPVNWQVDGVPPSSLNKALVLAADGGLRVTITATLPLTLTPPRNVVIKFPLVSFMFSDLSNPGTPLYWFVGNGWHRQTYYAVSDAFRARADLVTRDPTTVCPAPPLPCINVVGGPPKARAVLVLAGRNLATGPRTYTIANYFEDQNFVSTPASISDTPDYVFEHKLRSKTFNDRLVVVVVEP